MTDSRTVVSVSAPPEPAMRGSSWIGVVLFPVFAITGLLLGFMYSMPWLITTSLAISLSLLAVVGNSFLNRRDRAGQLRLALDGGATRIGPAPAARWCPLVAGSLAMLTILTDIGLRLAGYFAEEGGMTFSVMIALIVGWGLLDAWHGLKTPHGLKLTPSHLVTIGGMGKETAFPWKQVAGPPIIKGPRMIILVGSGETHVNINQVDSDPRLVMALVEAYRGRPARQSELGDGRVVQRAQTLRVK